MTTPTNETASLPKLNPKHAKFVRAYFALNLNATRAAQEAGYSDRREGYRLLQRPDVQAHVKHQLATEAMSEAEVKARLTQHARVDTDMDPFIKTAPTHRTFWAPAREHQPVRDLAKAKGVHVDDLDIYDLDGHFGGDNVARTSDGELLIKVAEVAHEVQIDWAAAKAAGMFTSFQSLELDGKGGVKYRLKDPLKALELLGRAHKIFADRTVLENPDGSPLKFMVGVSEDDL